MNHTLLDKVRCMMLSSSVPKSFWDGVFVAVCYLTNMTPSTTLNDVTSYEKWYNKCANYSMFRTFDFATFSHQSEGNLEPRANKCVF